MSTAVSRSRSDFLTYDIVVTLDRLSLADRLRTARIVLRETQLHPR